MIQTVSQATIDACATTEYDSDMQEVIYSQLMSVADAAHVLGVNRATIHRWIRADKLNAVRIGRMNLLSRSDILDLARQRQREALMDAFGGASPGPDSLRVVYEPMDDTHAFRIRCIAPDGSELVGVCRFEEDYNVWTEEKFGKNKK